MIKISIRFIDGSYDDWQEPVSVLDKLKELERNGYTGRSLIDELITDDWAAPPVNVRLEGKGSNGGIVDITLSYD